MKLKQARKVMRALLGAAAACLLLGGAVVGASPMAGFFFAAAGVALFFGFMAYNFSHWRCPHCGEYLGRNLGKGLGVFQYAVLCFLLMLATGHIQQALLIQHIS